MAGKFDCVFEDAVAYTIPDNIAPTLGAGSTSWKATGAMVTHSEATRILNDNDCLHYGTPENTEGTLPITRVSNG